MLLKKNIPHLIVGGTRFFERMEIKDAIAYLRIIVSDIDSLALERIINIPKRGIGEKTIQRLNALARENNLSLLKAIKLALTEDYLTNRISEELIRFINLLEVWRKAASSKAISHIDLAEKVLDESGYTDMLQNERTPEAEGRLENLKELVSGLNDFNNLQEFLDHVSLVMENQTDRDPNKISLMTMHGSKGLEFKRVYMPGWEEETFPNKRSMDDNGQKGLEEERRLAYVGLTRAKESCVISYAENRFKFGDFSFNIESRFIKELPEEHIEILTPTGLFAHTFNDRDNNSYLIEERSTYRSPGWARLTKNISSQPSQVVFRDKGPSKAFSINERVFHEKFGYGLIFSLEGDKATVNFEKSDQKNIKTSFLTHEKDV
jgi:DNA helicase-2/ATP-dependent DNA helicase PcrA